MFCHVYDNSSTIIYLSHISLLTPVTIIVIIIIIIIITSDTDKSKL